MKRITENCVIEKNDIPLPKNDTNHRKWHYAALNNEK